MVASASTETESGSTTMENPETTGWDSIFVGLINQLEGSVEISSWAQSNFLWQNSQDLKEKTNREGFVENSALKNLKRIALGALIPLEVEREKDKDNIRKVTSGGRDPEAKHIRRAAPATPRHAARRRKVE